jgi:CrcB protein
MIAIGGALGSIARYTVSTAIQEHVPPGFPWGTFVVNISGCLVLGIAITVLTERFGAYPEWRFLIPVGFIGAYTTFSTFELELFQTHVEGVWLVGLAYCVASVVVGYLALWGGVALARAL